MAKKITPGEHNMQMAKKAGKALLTAAIGPVGLEAINSVTGGVYDVLKRKDNQAMSNTVEKANNDKSVTENYSKASYGLPKDQWEKPTEYDALKVEQEARDKGYIPPSERNKPKEESIGRSKDAT